jgi:hypothetical protein
MSPATRIHQWAQARCPTPSCTPLKNHAKSAGRIRGLGRPYVSSPQDADGNVYRSCIGQAVVRPPRIGSTVNFFLPLRAGRILEADSNEEGEQEQTVNLICGYVIVKTYTVAIVIGDRLAASHHSRHISVCFQLGAILANWQRA